MSYSHRPGEFKSHLTGKTYKYETTGKRQKESKAAALAELTADHRAYETAAQQRAGRPVSLREMIHGTSEPETRSIREQVEAEVQHARQPGESGNPFVTRITELERQHKFASTTQQRKQIERKLLALHEASDKWDQKRAEQRSMEALLQSAPVARAISHAETVLQRLLADETSSEAEIAEARNRLQYLRSTGQVDEYQAAYEAFEEREKSALATRNAEMEQRLADIRAEYGIGEASSSLVESQAFGASEIEA